MPRVLSTASLLLQTQHLAAQLRAPWSTELPTGSRSHAAPGRRARWPPPSKACSMGGVALDSCIGSTRLFFQVKELRASGKCLYFKLSWETSPVLSLRAGPIQALRSPAREFCLCSSCNDLRDPLPSRSLGLEWGKQGRARSVRVYEQGR